MALTDSDGRFALRCWSDRRRTGAAYEVASDDHPGLKARAAELVRTRAYGYVEILAWNLELNDWVRIDSAGPA
jgi:hypothetical protein